MPIDVLLTHSYHLAYDAKQMRKMQPYPPLATLYCAAVLRKHGYSVALFDTTLRDPGDFGAEVEALKPRVVLVCEDDFNFLSKMCLARMREVSFLLLDAAKSTGAVAIAHGCDATDHTRVYLERGFDYVVIGEPERTVLELVSAICLRSRTDSITGVSAFVDGKFCTTAPRPLLKNLAELPEPARDLIDMNGYRRAWMGAHGKFSLNLISSRGCPFRCNWCAKPIFGDSFQSRSAVSVADELSQLRDVYGATHAWFADDIFGINRHWVRDFAREMRSRGTLPFKVQARADLINEDIASDLAAAGCEEVWMGVESGSQSVLDAMDKGLEVEQVRRARRALRSCGVRACYFLQLGYPGETWDGIQQTAELVRATQPDDIGVSVSYPLPNTAFYRRVEEELGSKRNWRDSDDLCVMFKGTYTDEFYRMVRDALHAEVSTETQSNVAALWRRIAEMEPLCRRPDATFGTVVDFTEECCAPVAFTQILPAGANNA